MRHVRVYITYIDWSIIYTELTFAIPDLHKESLFPGMLPRITRHNKPLLRYFEKLRYYPKAFILYPHPIKKIQLRFYREFFIWCEIKTEILFLPGQFKSQWIHSIYRAGRQSTLMRYYSQAQHGPPPFWTGSIPWKL